MEASELWLVPAGALTMGLATHEMATNAVKAKIAAPLSALTVPAGTAAVP
jgi:hypothetical protein